MAAVLIGPNTKTTTTKTTTRVAMNLSPYIPHLLHDFGEIQGKKFAYNSVDYLIIS
jgi:hypothetical protein